MHRIKKLTAILLCAGIMCLSSIEGVFAAKKPVSRIKLMQDHMPDIIMQQNKVLSH